MLITKDELKGQPLYSEHYVPIGLDEESEEYHSNYMKNKLSDQNKQKQVSFKLGAGKPPLAVQP
jgi:hypothetical protein